MRVFLSKISEDLELMKEWDHEKNQGISPKTLTRGSNVKVWWRCHAGHSWETTPNHRNRGSRCPVCANKLVLAGYNDLASRNPELLQEWDYEKNTDIRPGDCNYLSNRKVWWKCSQGHSCCSRNALVCSHRVTRLLRSSRILDILLFLHKNHDFVGLGMKKAGVIISCTPAASSEVQTAYCRPWSCRPCR